ncbi:nucleotide kinase domain-containing protein [Pelagerythrobacter sp.]|uniref:nucleotide kinase domain-containing protein n=1 Tax=Pelagerythrobacter sp. TaxID=2800702 RepID=UPI0035B49644
MQGNRSSVAGFFAFMAAREQLRIRKESGEPWPWSEDNILNTYKFTNVKRENDRTTQWMRRYWTRPNEDRPEGEIIFNCALFRYFGTSEFAAAVGWQREWKPDRCIAIASERATRKERVFTGAYIVPTLGHRGPKAEAVCNLILSPLWERREVIARVALETRRWEPVAVEMRRLPGFGGTGFMAKEVLQDVMHTRVLANARDRNTWCPAGPGARRGLNRVHGRPVGRALGEAKLLSEMIALLEASESALPSFMPELELHDIQFQLCEYDKYERVRLGEGRPKSRYVPPSPSAMRVTEPSGSI